MMCALQDPEGKGHVGDDKLVQDNSKGVETQLISPHRALANVLIRNGGYLTPEHGIETLANLDVECSVDREGIHDSPSSDEAASYQLRGY
ncbi:hypothetical protein Nepgr_021433 [Nepenthes gracilis]|uniref:Uncharacterized protein n=1 Tax=Nepenthes gracilis TaxID=150966 RepID=A0AAD3SZT7_NEPGR|nr:hypothetical protein Nepgr_021433 [Nepenthes gracilis]